MSDVAPVRGRKMHVEVLDGTWDFARWFDSFDVSIKGLASTHWEPDVNHVWRLMSRSMLVDMGLQSDAVECHHDAWARLPPDDDDAVLVLKDLDRRKACMLG